MHYSVLLLTVAVVIDRDQNATPSKFFYFRANLNHKVIIREESLGVNRFEPLFGDPSIASLPS